MMVQDSCKRIEGQCRSLGWLLETAWKAGGLFQKFAEMAASQRKQ